MAICFGLLIPQGEKVLYCVHASMQICMLMNYTNTSCKVLGNGENLSKNVERQ